MQQLSDYPKELKELETLIRSTVRPCIELKTELVKESLSVFTSKIGGDPFWPKDEPYPTDSLGYPMFMLAQINFAEMPNLPDFPNDGILQFYISAKDEQYGLIEKPKGIDKESLEQKNFRIKYWNLDELHSDNLVDFNFVWKSWFEDEYDDLDEIHSNWDRYDPLIPVYPINVNFSIKGKLNQFFQNDKDFRYNYNFDSFELDDWSNLYSLISKYDLWTDLRDNQFIPTTNSNIDEKYINFNNELEILLSDDKYRATWIRHHLGGFANSCQSDPRGQSNYFLDSIVLLGIDWESRPEWGPAEIMFMDSGIANFFIEPSNLKNKDFSRVLYYWDCC